MKENVKDIENKIEELLESIRPYLQKDRGDVAFVSLQDNVVKVRLLGSCEHCRMSISTLKTSIEDVIRKNIPYIKHVEAVNVK